MNPEPVIVSSSPPSGDTSTGDTDATALLIAQTSCKAAGTVVIWDGRIRAPALAMSTRLDADVCGNTPVVWETVCVVVVVVVAGRVRCGIHALGYR